LRDPVDRMPDYVYLLENRLSADQRNALNQLLTVARESESILFLTGDAVRDLTSGHAVHELEVSIHANPLKLKKAIEKLGGKIWGEDEPSRSLYLCFPGTVRVDLISSHGIEYTKPGKPTYHFASIQEDLRRRDFTANAMAISLNEGSYGLLMDPLNGAADVEARILRLVSNYGFIEDPALLIRAIRYKARLGWEMDVRTQARYDNAKAENAVEVLSPHARSQELEQIGHEEDALKVFRALEEEGWMKVLFSVWTSAKADEAKLNALHELAVALLMQGVHPDMSAAQMQLLTAKLPPKDLAALKRALLRPGFVAEWNNLDSIASAFAKVLLAKQNAKPSATYNLFLSYDPEAVLWLGFTSKSKEVQDRYNQFLKVWPEARQRIPYVVMQEMRITPELPSFNEIVNKIFLELIDGKLTTPEEMRAFLEPFSPPAPPPPVTIKRVRARRTAETKLKERAIDEDEESEDGFTADDDLEGVSDDEDLDLGVLPKGDLAEDEGEEGRSGEEDLEEDEAPAREKKQAAPAVKKGAKPEPAPSGSKPATGKTPASSLIKSQPVTAIKGKSAPAPASPKAPIKHGTSKPLPKAAQKTASKPAVKPVQKKAAKPAPTKAAKPKPKPAAKAKPVRQTPKSSKSAAKKPGRRR
jgi:tRNA nucleotidyltransferase (CCA-adding enzyme)